MAVFYDIAMAFYLEQYLFCLAIYPGPGWLSKTSNDQWSMSMINDQWQWSMINDNDQSLMTMINHHTFCQLNY